MTDWIIDCIKNHTTETIAIAISVTSAIIAFVSWRLSKRDFLLTHRPFLWVENFGYLDNDKIIINSINKVMIKVINSPANILSETYSYYILSDSNKKIIEEQRIGESIKYPSDKVQYTNTSAKVTQGIVNQLQDEENLFRLIRIEYKWLSSKKKYFFEGKWEYNKNGGKWDIVYQKAN